MDEHMRMILEPGQRIRQGSVRRTFLILLVFAFALVGGLSIVYSLIPAFVGAAAIFALGLWLITEEYRYPRAKPVGGEKDLERTALQAKRTLADRLVPIYLLLVWVYMIAPIIALSERDIAAAAEQAATSSGSPDKLIIIMSYGLVGTLFLPTAFKRFDTTFRWLLVLWTVYLVWAYTSLFWSVAPDMTIRRLVAFGLVSLGSLGLGAGFYGSRPDGRSRFLKHLIVAGVLSALALLVPLALSGGLANALDPAYRMTTGGNFMSFAVRPAVIALLVLAVSWMLDLPLWSRLNWAVVPILVLGLFLMKTRGPILYALLAFGIVYLIYKASLHERVFQFGLAIIVALGTYIVYYEGILSQMIPYLTRDDAELTLSLTGRVPLWKVLLPDVAERPLTGVGFAAYWNPETLYRMKELAGFPVVSAHNGFLEEILSTGVVGLILFLTFWLTAMVVSLKRVREGDWFGWVVFVFMLFYLIYNVTTSLIQSYLELPFIVVFVLLGLLARKPTPEPIVDTEHYRRIGMARQP